MYSRLAPVIEESTLKISKVGAEITKALLIRYFEESVII